MMEQKQHKNLVDRQVKAVLRNFEEYAKVEAEVRETNEVEVGKQVRDILDKKSLEMSASVSTETAVRRRRNQALAAVKTVQSVLLPRVKQLLQSWGNIPHW